MATHQHRLDVFGAHVQLLRKEGAVACRVKDACHAKHALAVDVGVQVRAVGHHVQRVGHNHQNGVGAVLHDVFRHGFHNARVGRDQVVAAHSGLPRKSAGDDHHVGICRFGVIVGRPHRAGVVQVDGRGLPNVKRLALGKAILDVQQHNFVRHFSGGQHICTSGAYVSGTDNSHFHESRFWDSKSTQSPVLGPPGGASLFHDSFKIQPWFDSGLVCVLAEWSRACPA